MALSFFTRIFCVLGFVLITCIGVSAKGNDWAKKQFDKDSNEFIFKGEFLSRKIKNYRTKGAKAALMAAGVTTSILAGPAAPLIAGAGALGVAAAHHTVKAVDYLMSGAKTTEYTIKKGTIEGETAERHLIRLRVDGGDYQYGYLESISIEIKSGPRNMKLFDDRRYQAKFIMKSMTTYGRLCDRKVYFMDKFQLEKKARNEELDFQKLIDAYYKSLTEAQMLGVKGLNIVDATSGNGLASLRFSAFRSQNTLDTLIRQIGNDSAQEMKEVEALEKELRNKNQEIAQKDQEIRRLKRKLRKRRE